MSEKVDGTIALTTPVILAFPNLFEAKKFKGKGGKEQGEPKFGASFALDPAHADTTTLKSLAMRVAKAKWPGRDVAAESRARKVMDGDQEVILPSKFTFPFKSGDKLCAERVAKLAKDGKPDDGKGDFQIGKVMIKVSSKFQPRLAVIANGKIVDLDTPELITLHKGKFFFGAEVLLQLNVVGYDKVGDGGTDGVTIYPNLILATGKGTRLSGGASAAEVFKGYVGSVSADDPGSNDLMDDSSF
jgi:hypothetical protein